MILASWNVNSLTVRLPVLIDWMRQHQPDVVCLQETKTVDEKFPTAEFQELGYQYAFYGEKTYNGVAIISNRPMINIQKGFIEEKEPSSRRFIEAEIDGVKVLNCYIPNGQMVGSQKYEYKLGWLSSLHDHLIRQHQPASNMVLCGDFNIAPSDLDVYKPSEVNGTIMCSDQERQTLERIRAWGFEDVFRLLNKEGGQFSWWDYRMGAFRRNMGFRIDHIWASAPLAARATRSWIDKEPRKLERPSDHAPVLAQFEKFEKN